MIVGHSHCFSCGPWSIALLSLLLAPSAAAEANIGSWQVSEEHSELDGNHSVSAVIHSEKQITSSIGLPETAVLAVVCSHEETRVVVDLRNFMGSSQVFVRYKIDNGPLEDDRVSVSGDGQFFGWTGGSAIDLTKAMSGKKKLVIAAAPVGKEETEASFNIGGLEDVIPKISAACKWDR